MSKVTTVGAYTLYLLHAWATLSAALGDWRYPVRKSPTVLVGGALSLFGLLLYAASVRKFSSFVQLSGLEEGELMTGGAYRYTRNPQIVGWGIALLGAALTDRSMKALALVTAYFLGHRLYFPFEERYLERAFGEEYRRYLARTPRFLGIPG